MRASITRRLLLVILIPIVTFMGFNPIRSQDVLAGDEVPNTNPTSPPVRVIESGSDSILIELLTPEYRVSQNVSEGAACLTLDVEGFGLTNQSGWPDLPVRGAMLGIPYHASPTITILETETSIAEEHYNLCPAAQPIFEVDTIGHIQYFGEELVKNQEAYQRDAVYPQYIVELDSTGYVRSQAFAQLRFQPFHYNPVSGELLIYERILVEVNFNIDSMEAESIPTTNDEPGNFENALQESLLNYEQARSWRSNPKQSLTFTTEQTAVDSDAYKILINQDGLYQLTYGDLNTAGLPVNDIDPRTFMLTNQGTEIALYLDTATIGEFNSGDYFLFYGKKIDTKFTDVNVYGITWGGENGLPMLTLDGTPSGTGTVPTEFQTTQRLEENHSYQTSRPSGHDNDHWYWETASSTGDPVTKTYTTTLSNISSTTVLSSTIRGLFKGYTATPNHHTKVYINDNIVDDATWASEAEYNFSKNDVAHSNILEGVNTIKLELPMDGGITRDYVMVNWYEIDYYDTYVAENDVLFFDGEATGLNQFELGGFSTQDVSVLDITNPVVPIWIDGSTAQPEESTYQITFDHQIDSEHHYLAVEELSRLSPLDIIQDTPSTLHDTNNGADYIIIAHGDLIDQTQPLVTHRQNQGLRVMVVDVQDVYDEFSFGIFDPSAIKDFLGYTYANWVVPAPVHVVLFGDGNFDFLDNFGWGEKNYIPPFLDDVDPWIGETAIDNRFVSVVGEDILPDMHIGRYPVKTPTEAQNLVTKIINYEQNPPPGDWNEQVLFIADDADGGGNFEAFSDDIVNNHLPSAYTPHKIYYDVTHTDVALTRQAIIDEFNAGRLLVNYVGHAGVQYWASEKFFQISSLASLSNGPKLPFMVPMTCQEGYFVWPKPPDKNYTSLAESVVTLATNGAIASWSPTGFGIASGHDYLNKALYDEFLDKGNTAFGSATTAAKLHLYSSTGSHRELIETYVLFGDPATKLQIPEATASMSLVPGWNLLTLPLQPSEAIDAQALLDDINEGSGTCTEIDR